MIPCFPTVFRCRLVETNKKSVRYTLVKLFCYPAGIGCFDVTRDLEWAAFFSIQTMADTVVETVAFHQI